jgi:hypothetical protein
LHLIGAPPERRDRDVVARLCTWLDQPEAPFLAVEHLARGERAGDPDAVFASYYHALCAVEARIDRMIIHPRGSAP